MGEKVGKKVGEKRGEKVGESLGEIDKLNLASARNTWSKKSSSKNAINFKTLMKAPNIEVPQNHYSNHVF